MSEAWDAAMESKRQAFENRYSLLQSEFPEKSFDFYTDGDPPDKEDDWKLFTTFASMKDGNTLTLVRKNEDERERKILKWTNKGVKNVYLKTTAAGKKPVDDTLEITQAVVVVNIAPETTVFDASEDTPMRDGANFEEFQIKDGKWTVPTDDEEISRLILRADPPGPLEDTDVMTRDEMKDTLTQRGVQKVVVRSSGQTEVNDRLGSYEKAYEDAEFAIYKKAEN